MTPQRSYQVVTRARTKNLEWAPSFEKVRCQLRLYCMTSNLFGEDRGRPLFVILLPLLIVVATIQVLPQVDLPDTAFHTNTTPIVAKSRATAAPALGIARQQNRVMSVRTTALLSLIPQMASTVCHRAGPSLPILFLAILC